MAEPGLEAGLGRSSMAVPRTASPTAVAGPVKAWPAAWPPQLTARLVLPRLGFEQALLGGLCLSQIDPERTSALAYEASNKLTLNV